MTLARPTSKLPRRIQTDTDLAAATRVAEGMHAELDDLLRRRRELEEKYPILTDPGEDADELPEGLQAHYDKLVFRIGGLQRELLAWSNTASQVVLKQIEARHKSGELVSVSSVATYLNTMMLLIKKYADRRYLQQAERDARQAFQTFVQANPAALLEAGAQAREQQELED
ncbi:hypothetical protein [Deinococcus sp. S9]|uniref:hypothetical protein n=1 Tax=Deinococcus sp. S9 TaxID=2545754 RepID=UPI0014048360|nr:hypothetical protein [Deinococcus sp. S9]